MRKKVIGILLTVAMAATLLAGCGSSSSTASSDAATDAAVSEQAEEAAEEVADQVADAVTDGEHDWSKAAGKKVGMTVPTLSSDFINYLTQALTEALGEYDVELQVDSCEGDVTTQIEQMENFATMGMDCVVAFAVNGEALTATGQNIMNQGTPVLAFAMDIPDGCTVAMISAEEADMGAACGDMAVEWIDKTYADAGDGEVKVYLLRGTTSPEIVERSDAIQEVLEQDSKINLIVEENENENDQSVSRKTVENQFQANPDIDVIVTCNGESALGANSYIMSSDSPIEDLSTFGIFTVDETDEIDANIQQSLTNESSIRGTISMGAISDTVNDFMKSIAPILCEEETIPPLVNGAYFVITGDNVEDYLNK